MSKPLRVLIVEDSEDDAALLVRELRRGGFKVVSERVETAGTMDSALELADWDVILSDFTMPNFSAPRALELLKQRNLDVPFIIVSGTIGEETAVEALKAGAQDFLVKGRLARLVPAIERELREALNRRQRRRAESALRESEARFRQIAETIDEVFWVADPKTAEMLYVSPAYERVWGRPVTELHNNPKSFLDSVHPDDRKGVLSVFEAEKTGQTFRYEYRIVRPDGTLRWIWDRGFPVRNESGQLIRYVGVAADITERKWTEAENARLAMIVNSSEDAIFSVTSDEAVATWNRGAERMYGYTAEEITGKHVSTLIPEELQRDMDHGRPRLARGESLVHYDHVNQRKDGTKFPVSLTLSPIKDATGAFTGVSIIARDITERARAEEDLIEQKNSAQAYLDIAGVMLLALNSNQEVVLINLKGCEILGYGREEIIGRHWSTTFLPLRDRDRLDVAFEKLKSGSFDGVEYMENSVLRKTGEERLIAWHNTVLRDASGKFVATLSSGEDITERRQLEDQFRQAQKMEAVGRLAGGVAHDFNNLLTIINGYSEMMQERLPPSDPTRGQLEEIRKAGMRAASLTRQLLAFSRQQVLAPRDLSLNALVSDVEKMLRRLIGEDVELKLELDPNLGTVRADPGQIDQILMNLAVNARDAMPQGGRLTIASTNVDLDASVSAEMPLMRPGHYVMLSVIDTGVGMDATTQARIFEPFFTTKPEGKGTGLGLAMVYGTVKQSGGFIWVSSEVGKGATFRIYLPRVEEAAGSILPEGVQKPSLTGSETILLLEDEEAVRGLASRVLHNFGYRVIECASPEDALRIGEQYKESIHLLLTDVVLPRVNGRQVAEQLSRLRPEMRVLYMSGYTDDSILHSGVRTAQTAFLQKPFAARDLAAKVREVLDARIELQT